MAIIRQFEDIVAWQKARVLTKQIYEETCKGKFASDYALRDQMRRASASIMLNIAEGFGRKTNNEFKQFLVHAHGSCAEIQAALYIALDQRYLSEQQFHFIYNSADEISRMLMGLHKSIRSERANKQS